MAPPGRAAFEARRSAAGVYSFESKPVDFPAAMKRRFRAAARAYAFWSAQPPGYRRVATFWVAVGEAGRPQRARRLDVVIACSKRGERIPLLARAKPGR